MFVVQQLRLLLLFVSFTQTSFVPVASTRSTLLTTTFNRITNLSTRKINNTNSSYIPSEIKQILPEDTSNSDTISDEIKNEVSVNTLLDKVEEPTVIAVPELHKGPHYELDWNFIDKDTIRVTFDLFSVPTSLIENNIYSEPNERRLNILAIMTTMPSRPLKTIKSLRYYLFIIRPYHKNREIVLKMEKLFSKNTTSRPYHHFSNPLRLTALNHNEKYSVCISYYRVNNSINAPDLLLCQDIINDYSKFGDLHTDPKHGLLFIATQYSIILALLLVLQAVFTIRKRRIAQVIARHLTNKAHHIRSTLSSVSLTRQSFSSLDAEHHQQHTINQHESMTHEEGGSTKRILSSPAIVLSEPSTSVDGGANNSEETEPFLKRIPSKNHVHFLLGPGEEDDDNETENIETTTLLDSHATPTPREPYSDQTDALQSMAHILDTNKPWSRHN